jgi:hypothetical protein
MADNGSAVAKVVDALGERPFLHIGGWRCPFGF